MPRAPESFWSKADRSGGPEACWPWNPSRSRKGYGQVTWDGGRVYTHRLAWILTNGPIPPGLCVCHRCDNPPCVNPAHLFLGTKAINNADMRAKGREKHPSGSALAGPRNRARGERAGSAKLTAAEVIRIRALLAAGISQRDLSAMIGVPRGTISGIALRLIWAHLPEGALMESA